MRNSVDFQISALPYDFFRYLFNRPDSELAATGARRVIADSKPGFPCRVSLQEAEIGETVILLAYAHHDMAGPYHSVGPIYVREMAKPADLKINELPEVVATRLISVRAYDAEGFLMASDVVAGNENLRIKFGEFFTDPKVAYLHLHNAKPGCYSCRVDRAL